MAPIKFPLTEVEILGKKSIFFGTDITTFLVKDLMSVSKAGTFVIITDTELAAVHLAQLRSAFGKVAVVEEIVDSAQQKNHNILITAERQTRKTKSVLTYVIPPGEGSKSREMAGKIQDFLLGEGLNPDTCLIAFGGGVIGDLVGYVASTFLRGIEFVQIPTTLLAMADSSIGGKNGVDTPHGKNLIGTTYQPIRIYTDPAYLLTLPQRHMANGMAEVIKTYALMGESDFAALEQKVDKLEGLLEERTHPESPEAQKIFAELILNSIKFKAEIVTDDVGDRGHRQALNFGHTIGHALETHFDGTILHGECVGVGMLLEQQIAIKTKWGKAPDLDRLKQVLIKVKLPTSVTELEVMASNLGKIAPTSTDQLLRRMKLDKKNLGKHIHMALLAGFGKPARSNRRSIPISDPDILGVLRRQLNQKGRKIRVESPADSPYALKSVPPTLQGRDNSVVVIGYLGDVLGDKLAAALNWDFVHNPSLEVFRKSLKRFVISIPPTERLDFEKVLLGWMRKGGIVIQLLSPTASLDKDSHAIFSALELMSNYSYHFNGDIKAPADLDKAADTLLHLVEYAHGKHFNVLPRLETRSYFLSLLVGDVTPYLPDLPSMVSGTWALEIRLDLLDPLHDESIACSVQYFKEFLAKQVGLIREAAKGHPIIFTFRTVPEGGKFSTENISEAHLVNLFHYAIRLGCEFIDIEMDLPSALWAEIGFAASQKSVVIASFHSIAEPLDWSEDGESLVDKAVELGGDIIKLVSMADSAKDNENLEKFVEEYYGTGTPGLPLIAFNQGATGHPTRVTNRFMTPVTHSLLPCPPSISQLTCQEIQKLYYRHHVPQRKELFLFGADIGYSLSPLLHNTNFEYFSLPFKYVIKDTKELDVIKRIIRNPSFAGASVTIPHKQSIIPYLDSLTKVAEQIGAVNTIVVEQDGSLRGENTDWLGILHCIGRKLRACPPRELAMSSALLIGAGGTARSALYALHSFGFKKVYISNRTESRIEELKKCYPVENGRTELKIYNGKMDSLSKPDCPLVLIVNTTVGNSGMCPHSSVNLALKEAGTAPRVFVNLAYSNVKSSEDEELKPWISFVSGLDILIEQAIWAAILWTGLKPDVEFLKKVIQSKKS